MANVKHPFYVEIRPVDPSKGAVLYWAKSYRGKHDGPFTESFADRVTWKFSDGPTDKIRVEAARGNRKYGELSFRVREGLEQPREEPMAKRKPKKIVSIPYERESHEGEIPGDQHAWPHGTAHDGQPFVMLEGDMNLRLIRAEHDTVVVNKCDLAAALLGIDDPLAASAEMRGAEGISGDDPEEAMFAAYAADGGQHARGVFHHNLRAFYRLTKDAYIHGEGTREEAWKAWVKHIGSQAEAHLYFAAVDAIQPYS